MRTLNIALVASAFVLSVSASTIGNSGFEIPQISTGNYGGCTTVQIKGGNDYIIQPTACGQVWVFDAGSGIASQSGFDYQSPLGPDGSSQVAILQQSSDFYQVI